jgi:hypothetical protein
MYSSFMATFRVLGAGCWVLGFARYSVHSIQHPAPSTQFYALRITLLFWQVFIFDFFENFQQKTALTTSW